MRGTCNYATKRDQQASVVPMKTIACKLANLEQEPQSYSTVDGYCELGAAGESSETIDVDLSMSDDDTHVPTREEQRVLQSPAPPWYDEDLPSHFQKSSKDKSMIFQTQYKEILEDLYAGYDCNAPFAFPVGIPNLELPLIFSAVIVADLPFLKAVLRRGANLDPIAAQLDGVTPLMLVCKSIEKDGITIGERSLLDILTFLLQVGADPDIADIHGNTPLHCACRMGNTEVVAVLLQFKAATAFKNVAGATAFNCSKTSLHRKLAIRLVKEYELVLKPERLCPCGSMQLFCLCHGQKDGVPVHPRSPCPCKPTDRRKRYEQCCMKRGKYFRETLDQVIETRTITDKHAIKSIAQYMSAYKESCDAAGMTEEEVLQAPLFPGVNRESYTQMYKQMLTQMVKPGVASGEMDPGFGYACLQTDFIPGLWESNLSKTECRKRQDEWNSLIDEYIKSPASHDDTRINLEIERECKIGPSGGALLRQCSNPVCQRTESSASEFKSCAKCLVSAYCRRDCQRIRHDD